MGKPKKDRTDQVIDAGKRIVLAGQIQNTLEQRKFDRLVAQGVIIEQSMLKVEAVPVDKGGAMSLSVPMNP